MILEEVPTDFIDEYKIIHFIGYGSQAKVVKAIDPNNAYVAIKFQTQISCSQTQIFKEADIMAELRHKNILQLLQIRKNAKFHTKSQSCKCFAIVVQYSEVGSLFDLITQSGPFSQKVARTYFHHLMNGIHYMHVKGYVHRDLKLQNLLISEEFLLKIADFGYAQTLYKANQESMKNIVCGTQGYMAPQIDQQQYDGKKADIFAAGVILFILYVGIPPFQSSRQGDQLYSLIRNRNMQEFWQRHKKFSPQIDFSQNFKDLLEGLMAYESKERYDIYQIAQHQWVNQKICTQSEIKYQIEKRRFRLDIEEETSQGQINSELSFQQIQ